MNRFNPIIILFIISLFFSCYNLEVVDLKYNSYIDAINDKYFNKSIMPKELFLVSAKNIYHRSELDTYKFWIKYEVNYNDFQKIKHQLFPVNKFDLSIHENYHTPKWWIKNVKGFEFYTYTSNKGSIFYFIMNEKTKLIYGFLYKYKD